MNNIPFKEWIEKFRHEDTPLGDLAHDIHFDPRFPSKSTDKSEILEYLKARGAIPEAIQTFQNAWRKYLKG